VTFVTSLKPSEIAACRTFRTTYPVKPATYPVVRDKQRAIGYKPIIDK
jgi:hypothetical protein